MHSAHLGSTCSVSGKFFSCQRQKKPFRPLSGLLKLIVGKLPCGFRYCQSKLWAIFVLQTWNFLPLLPLQHDFESVLVPGWPRDSCDLAVMVKQSNPSAAFLKRALCTGNLPPVLRVGQGLMPVSWSHGVAVGSVIGVKVTKITP